MQDFVILCASVRRDGKSLGQMAKEEIGPVAGYTALVAVLGIMIVLIAVLALVVVNRDQGKSVGVVPSGHHSDGVIRGVYLSWCGPRVGASASDGAAHPSALPGRGCAEPTLAPRFTVTGNARSLISGYSLFASVLPVWMMPRPRLSSRSSKSVWSRLALVS